ncbi:MAG TPA: alpha/beta fold hydrolase [Gemmatimonadales bacterium]|jgi:homoserine O-acetyltransferase/O-succinyltransferase|nr:alpha/beta fold hydrolase [Gemmatimonadales bacterium]
MRRLPPAPVFCLAALLPFAARPARALQAAPGDHAAHHRFVLPSFTFEDGTTLSNTVVSYGTYGRLNAARDNVILLPSSYMADHHDNDWLIGPGLALDTTRWFLVATELFGNGHSSSPSNTPEPHHGPRFPRATIRDNIEAVHHLLVDELHVRRLAAVIGFSMGAEQAFQWAVSYPDFMDRIVALAGTARCWPHGKVRLDAEIAAIRSDTAFRGGDYTTPPRDGIRLFGLVWAGWLTSQEWWHDELWKGPSWPPGDSYESVVSYFADSLFTGLDANDLILQAETWRQHDVGTTEAFDGSLARALGAIRARVLYMPVATDLYFPVSDARAEAKLIQRVELVPIPSVWGHVAGGGGDEGAKPFVNARIAGFLREPSR